MHELELELSDGCDAYHRRHTSKCMSVDSTELQYFRRKRLLSVLTKFLRKPDPLVHGAFCSCNEKARGTAHLFHVAFVVLNGVALMNAQVS